jgi:hypothetical protein
VSKVLISSLWLGFFSWYVRDERIALACAAWMLAVMLQTRDACIRYGAGWFSLIAGVFGFLFVFTLFVVVQFDLLFLTGRFDADIQVGFVSTLLVLNHCVKSCARDKIL